MYAPMRARGAQSYAQVGLETTVNNATPEKLIALLFDGARAAIARARLHLEHGNIQARGITISKAIEIVSNGLKASLDHDAGGDIAANLNALYDYIERCLLLANLNADVAKLNEADTLLAELASAWNEMAAQNVA